MNEGRSELLGRILILVDVQNLFYTARDAYGYGARVDFRKVRDAALKGAEAAPRRFKHIMSRAYMAAKPDDIPEGFVSALEKLNYDVVLTNIRSHETGDASATNIDVQLATDAGSFKVGGDNPDIVVVASGDSDFISVYKALKGRGIRVEVLAFAASLGAAVANEVDYVGLLAREHLFDERQSKETE